MLNVRVTVGYVSPEDNIHVTLRVNSISLHRPNSSRARAFDRHIVVFKNFFLLIWSKEISGDCIKSADKIRQPVLSTKGLRQGGSWMIWSTVVVSSVSPVVYSNTTARLLIGLERKLLNWNSCNSENQSRRAANSSCSWWKADFNPLYGHAIPGNYVWGIDLQGILGSGRRRMKDKQLHVLRKESWK